MDFSSTPPPPAGTLTSTQREAVMEQVRNQIAVTNAQELLQRITKTCFKKCVTKPGTQLDSYEQKCVAMCMDRYMDSWNAVSRTYNERITRDRSLMS